MARTLEDALRSLARFVWVGLGEEWEVRLFADQGTFQVPFARVVSTGPTALDASAYHGSVTAPVAVWCYLGAEETDEGAELAGMRLRERVEALFAWGGEANQGYPMRVPLFDYEGVPYPGVGVRRGERDFLRVSGLSVMRQADPDDGRFVIVVAEMSLRWTRASELASDRIAGTPVELVQVEYVAERQSQIVSPAGIAPGTRFGVPVMVQ